MRPREMYDILFAGFGPQHWWPGDLPFEIMVGAILTQQTSWSNVEKAIANLKGADMLAPGKIASAGQERLEALIRPTGFYRQKARYLRGFCRYLLDACGGDIGMLFSRPLDELRVELLDIPGIGPETADSILLYAGSKPIFVVDAYTIRICRRTGIFHSAKYGEVKEFFEASLPQDVRVYNECHALLVKLGKDFCRPKSSRCGDCPLSEHCRHARTGTEK